ncbi:MAG: redoxin domain-containing protein [Melioribacteraceae bacterium]|nr:redoxin domain-containing protein [Melioribacteraceae bacterium]
MKTKLFVLFLFAAILTNAQSNNFSFSPEKPIQDQKITVNYEAKGTSLEKSNEIKAYVYEYGKDLYSTSEYPVKSNSFTVTPSDSALGLFIVFKEGEKQDNNDGKGYVIQLSGKDGKLLPGADAALATAYAMWVAYVDLGRDYEKAILLFEKDFAANPNVKKDYLSGYFNAINGKDPAKAKDKIHPELEKLSKTSNLNEEQYSLLANWYERTKDIDNSAKYKKLFNEKFPNNESAMMEKYTTLRKTNDLAEKTKIITEIKKDFSHYKNFPYFLADYTKALIANKKYQETYDFLEENYKPEMTSQYGSLANTIVTKDTLLDLAQKVLDSGVAKAKTNSKYISPTKPPYMTNEEWFQNNDYTTAVILSTQGELYEKLGKQDEALKAYTEAVELNKEADPEVNEAYVKLLVELNKFDKAKTELEKFIKESHSTPAMKDLLSQAYSKTGGSADKFDSYYSLLREVANTKMKDELKEKMMNDPAPVFTLKDLDGTEVSLASLKGKTVIVDFWATWCGPCLASFPAMQKAVEKYAKNDKVKFLFVNTWERVEDKIQNAKDFIVKTKYPFQVLMDLDNSVITSYKVSGIPTKFIIDKNGNIRFKSVGYEGDADKMVEEISAMISLIE